MEIKDILKKLELEDTGKYERHFYVIELEDSNEYSRMFTKLSNFAINTEYPNFEQNTNGTTTKVTNYFELDLNNKTYNIFLFADFDNERYFIKIGEK